MKVKILGKVWDLVFKPFPADCTDFGLCDGPHVKGKKITINVKKKGEERLDTLLHEILHAADWHKDEEWVVQVATDTARILTRLGYHTHEE